MSPADFFAFLFGGSWSWIVIAVVACGVPIAVPAMVRHLRGNGGPVLPGTAEVLSLRQFGSLALNGPMKMICRIRLRVVVRDQEPYEATLWRLIAPWDLGGLRRGATLGVDVSAKNPKRVRMSGYGPDGYTAGAYPAQNVRDRPPTSHVNPNAHGDFVPAAASTPPVSAAEILAHGQRVPAVLTSFAPIAATSRGAGRTPSREELSDAPHYLLEVELRFPNLNPVVARAVQPVPVDHVPELAIGLELPCVVDPADPSRRFVVDWSRM